VKAIIFGLLLFCISGCKSDNQVRLDHVRGLEDCVAIYVSHPISSYVIRCKASSVSSTIKTAKSAKRIIVVEPEDDEISAEVMKLNND